MIALDSSDERGWLHKLAAARALEDTVALQRGLRQAFRVLPKPSAYILVMMETALLMADLKRRRTTQASVRLRTLPRSGMFSLPQQADSAFVVAVNLDTRKVDTLGTIRTPHVVFSMTRTENGYETRSALSPLPRVDDWAVLPDGAVAFVRGLDFVDYANTDGTASSSEKLPSPWVRLTDDD